jgi:sugar phosphate permease
MRDRDRGVKLMADPTAARPSKGRWYVLLLISVMYLITYLDRVNISTAAPEISKEFGFDKVTMGVIFSAFAWSYALFQVPGGWLSDRFGARGVLTGVVGFWSIMTAATAAAFSATSFIAIRFMFGVGEAGAFPGATRAMQLWYPRPERGLVQGVTHSASRLGAAIAPPIVVLIMSEFGWRPVFYICGAVGFLWSLWWALTYRNLPEDHPLVNKAELQAIRGVDSSGVIKPPPMEQQTHVPWMTLIRSPNMWAIMCAYFTYVYCLWIFLSWLPSYLIEARHFTLLKVGIYASLPLFAGVIGDTLGGLATDRRPARLRDMHCAGGAHRQRVGRGRRPHRLDVLSGIHHRPVLGRADGYGRQIFRHGIRHDEHGGQFWRGYFADRIRGPGAGRQLGSTLHRRRRSAGCRCGGLGVLAGPRQAYLAELIFLPIPLFAVTIASWCADPSGGGFD